MQSIFKNAFDKVSVIKEVVEHSIEEAVKINSKDAGVFNSGTSISSSIANWAEKNNVSERANNIKASASMFVEDLAIGLKGMTNNISLQNHVTLIDKFNKNQMGLNKEKEYDYFSEELDSIHNSEVSNGKIYENSSFNNKLDSEEINFSISKEENSKFNNRILEDKEPFSNDKIESRVDNLKLVKETNEGKDMENEYDDKSRIHQIEIKNNSNLKEKNDIIGFEEDLNKIKNSSYNTDDANKKIGIKNGIYIGNSMIESGYETIQDEFLKITETSNMSKDVIDNFVDNKNHILEKYCFSNETNKDIPNEDNNIQKIEKEISAENNFALNPLSVFQEMGQLEKQNISLKNELELMRNESLNLNEKIKTNERIVNNLNYKNTILMNEINSLTNRLKELEAIENQHKSKIIDLESKIEKKNLDENLSREQTDIIKLLKEKVTELEEALELGEAGKIEFLKNYQNEIVELRQKLSQLKEKENEISLPYVNRISKLEHQLSEIRKRHSNELQRFQLIIENLKNQIIKEKNEYSDLEDQFKKLKNSSDSVVKKYEFQISNFKDIIEKLENKSESQSYFKDYIGNHANENIRLSVCTNINDIFIKEVIPHLNISDKKKSLIEKKTLYFQNPFLSQTTNNSSVIPLQEEIKQAIHDKQLLEEEYLQICEKKRQTEKELFDEKQRNKLLQQQLDNMFKLVNDLTEKLDESNEIINLQKHELNSIHLRLK